MAKYVKDIGRKFLRDWKSYILQSLFATVSLVVIVLILGADQIVTVASMAATAFIIFTIPHRRPAQAENVIGGHFVGLVSGFIVSFVFSFISSDIPGMQACMYAVTVGLSMFAMVATDTEHAPAAGTALDVVIDGFNFEVAVTLLLFVSILSVIRHVFSKFLKDLA